MNFARIAFIAAIAFLAYLFALVSYRMDWFPARGILQALDDVKRLQREWEVTTGVEPTFHLARKPGSEAGVLVNRYPPDNDDVVLLTSFFDGDPALRALRRDGTVLATWPARFHELFPDPGFTSEPIATDWNVDIHGAVMLEDGGVVFNLEYAGLVNMDRCGGVRWTLPRMTHHSVERDGAGGFWVSGRNRVGNNTPSRLRPWDTPYLDDTVLRVSADGEVLDEFSVGEMMVANGLEHLLTPRAEIEVMFRRGMLEPLHLNDVQPLGPDLADRFPGFEAGDLALSLRRLHLVMVVDPDTRTVKWHRSGPWLNQHDPEFSPRGTLVVFNNNAYRRAATGKSKGNREWGRSRSNLVEVDPVSDEARILHRGSNKYWMRTTVRGAVDLTPRGHYLVAEFDGGRALEVDENGDRWWEYVNRFDERRVLEITGARVYPGDYFDVEDWSCP